MEAITQDLEVKPLKISEEEYTRLQAQYKKLYVIDVEVEKGETYQFIATRPKRALIECIAANRNDLVKVNSMILKNMVVAGDMDALDDGIVYSAVMRRLGEIVEGANSFFRHA